MLALAIVAVALAAAGCGGSDSSDSGSVAQITDFANQQLAARLDDNQDAEPFDCVDNGDGEWECATQVTTTNANGDKDTTELKVNVTCDAANCTYVPET
jgi:hypothetical protein